MYFLSLYIFAGWLLSGFEFGLRALGFVLFVLPVLFLCVLFFPVSSFGVMSLCLFVKKEARMTVDDSDRTPGAERRPVEPQQPWMF